MSKQFINRQQVVSNCLEISDEEWNYYTSMLQVKVFKKNAMLCSKGTTCKNVLFIRNNEEKKTFHLSQRKLLP
jgi:hypothetical protein